TLAGCGHARSASAAGIDIAGMLSIGTAPEAIAYHGFVVASARKNAARLSATLSRPLVEGCVPSLLLKSEHAHVRPSERGVSPSAHRYGPHDSHGASTGPTLGS